MDKIIDEIKNVLENTPYFHCESCFLRGSLISKKYKEVSDIDILVLSNDFKYISYLKRRELIQNAMEELNSKMISVDALCLSKEEYMQLIYEKRKMLKDERMVRIL